jgi:hypothetical protein
MAIYTVWMLEKSNITVSGGGTLDGVTQGDGSHLVGRSITLNSNAFVQTSIEDDDTSFEDNDTSQQTLNGAQTINGVNYASGTRVEAEYCIVLRDPETGQEWTAYAYNVNNSSPNYATVEGLVVRPNPDGSFPPFGAELQVISATEGPFGLNSNLYDLYDTPPCFTPGTLIATPEGPRAIETLRPGDLVLTRDHGPQPLRWMGEARLRPEDLLANPGHRPVRIEKGALGDGLPYRDLTLSPQHRLLFGGWRAQVLFGEDEVLVPALALVGDLAGRAAPAGVRYLHLLFDQHEIIFAEGAEVESLMPGWLADANLPAALRDELRDLVPDLVSPAPGTETEAARRCLTAREGRLLA